MLADGARPSTLVVAALKLIHKLKIQEGQVQNLTECSKSKQHKKAMMSHWGCGDCRVTTTPMLPGTASKWLERAEAFNVLFRNKYKFNVNAAVLSGSKEVNTYGIHCSVLKWMQQCVFISMSGVDARDLLRNPVHHTMDSAFFIEEVSGL